MKRFSFYFDFISPFGYLASLAVPDFAARHGAEADWRSMLLGISVLKVQGGRPLLEVPLKGPYIQRDAYRYARRHGIVFGRRIDAPPSRPIAAARAFTWLRERRPALAVPAAQAIFAAYWDRAEDISEPAQVIGILDRADLDTAGLAEAFASGEAADLLKAAIDASIAAGVFGSPFFLVGEEPFFGLEKMPVLGEWLDEGGW
ncbi:MAG: 2-hydroxychromene-2-carboxylate isomerase [Alphaproteobacteria bacterium]|jgi:2-hydroxychromene-2-carboxylate isomerase|nr:2-hydroxychromene-2-carboxylate isomerase [Alphaproteobacteria bacterium]